MSHFKAKLALAKLPQRTHDVCLNGDLVAEYEQLERELEAAEGKVVDSLAGNGTEEIVERMDAIQAQMRESIETFTIRALPHRKTARDQRPTYDELVQQHPPRRDAEGKVNEVDKGPGYDTTTFPDALIRECTISPEMDDSDWDGLFTVLSEGQFSELYMVAAVVNRGGVDIPFSRAALRAKRHSSAE